MEDSHALESKAVEDINIISNFGLRDIASIDIAIQKLSYSL